MKPVKVALLFTWFISCATEDAFKARAATRGSEEAAVIITPSSTYSAQYSSYYAVDGNPKTRWSSALTGRATLILDFGKPMVIDAVDIHWEAAYSTEYQVQVSMDQKTWNTLFHQRKGEGGCEKLSKLKGKGRYFRINCLKASQKHKNVSIWEVGFENPELIDRLKNVRGQESKTTSSKAQAQSGFAQHGVREIVFATRADGNDGHWYANFGHYSYDDSSMLYGKGGRLCKLDVETCKVSVLIDDPEGTVRDPVVHYDAEKILFSWRKAESKVFHLYECDLNGGNITQITNGEYDDIEPCYLPDCGIVFVSGRGKRYVNCWLTQVAIVYRCDADGSNVRQLSANIEHDNTPWVMPNGQIIYQRWEYIDRSQVHYHHLWTMNPDGTGQTVYYGNLHPGGLYIDAKPIPGTDEVLFINSPGHGAREHSGHVAIVHNRQGPDCKEALRNVTKGKGYRDPWPLSSDLFIAAKGKSIVAMNRSGEETTVYTLPESFGKAVNLQEPRPVIPREREIVLGDRTDAARSTGKLILQDVNIGRNMGGVKRGEIKKLLVMESLPKPINFTGGMDPLTYGGSFTLERVLGTIPVREDGSAYMELPALRSLFFIALDKDDNSVKRMQSFLTVMPGEVQSCVGCHEDRSATPPAVPPGRLLAFQQPASKVEPIAGIPDVFDFPRDIQPILDKHCVSCHSQEERAGNAVLTGDRGPVYSHSYVTLTLRKQIADGRNLPQSNYAPRALGASASPLMRMISGEHYDVRVSDQERDMIRYWIESGAPYPGTYAALGHGSIGGYQQNKQINEDKGWATAQAFTRVVKQQCAGCHQRELGVPTPGTLSDEMGISFWRPDWNDKRFRFSRHLMFNLSRPEKSIFLLGPLAKDAGGLGLCKEPVFDSAENTEYQALLAHIRAGKNFLEKEETRFDMPNFRPRDEYFRELKRYGILPDSFDPGRDEFDVYELDRKYWQSLWYQPEPLVPQER